MNTHQDSKTTEVVQLSEEFVDECTMNGNKDVAVQVNAHTPQIFSRSAGEEGKQLRNRIQMEMNACVNKIMAVLDKAQV